MIVKHRSITKPSLPDAIKYLKESKFEQVFDYWLRGGSEVATLQRLQNGKVSIDLAVSYVK